MNLVNLVKQNPPNVWEYPGEENAENTYKAQGEIDSLDSLDSPEDPPIDEDPFDDSVDSVETDHTEEDPFIDNAIERMNASPPRKSEEGFLFAP